MGNRISNEDLHDQLKDFKVESNRKFDSLSNVIMEMQKEFRQMHDWWVGRKEVEKYTSSLRSGGSFNWSRVIELLVQGLVTAIAIIGVLLGVDKIK